MFTGEEVKYLSILHISYWACEKMISGTLRKDQWVHKLNFIPQSNRFMYEILHITFIVVFFRNILMN